MNAYVERTCTEGRKENARLSDYRGTDAHVLLGGPGSGKTRTFQEEEQTAGGLYVPAHDFVELTPRDELRDRVLFIDGLDELRARSPSPEPLGQVRTRLDELGKPRFRLSCRKAEFRFPPPRDVMEALAGGAPADARDLSALAYDELAALGRSIRDDQTSDWRQYWHRECEPWQPQAENDCRDHLLSDLSPRLRRFNVTADKEPTYADDKRADIRISCHDFNVPIEVKTGNSKDLWSAISCQLVPKYTRDPGAAGHGIFLVFWFGPRLCRPSKTGRRPASAAALQALLVESLPTELSGQIKVLVIDVSRPDTAPSRDR